MTSQQLKKFKLPDTPGVYFFLGPPKRSGEGGKQKGKILYIGKATSLRDRTRSYFAKDLVETRGPSIVDMVFKSTGIDWQETDTVLEALILEANLIKKYQPYYNVKEKDDKSWNYVVITDEELPKVLVIRGKELQSTPGARLVKFGPFTSGGSLREALKIIRRIFPFVDENSVKKDQKEFYKQLGLTPESKKEYKNNIKHIKLFFEGKKKKILTSLEKEMKTFAKLQRFEEAGRIRNQIYALSHINDVALIKNDIEPISDIKKFRIEAYDIAHMSGKNMVGVMTVVSGGEVNKNEYRKFIIRTQSDANDTGALEEILSRRFRHTEWGMPDLVVMDGAEAQLRVAKQVLNRYQLEIPIVSVVKDERHKAKAFLGDENLIKKHKRSILLANSEAHRFAITFHKKKRAKSFLS